MESISIEQIEKLCKMVVEKLKSEKMEFVFVDIDEYWIIPASDWANFKDSPEPNVGSMKDDITYLKKAVDEGRIYSYSEFERFATLLRYISEKEAPSD